MLKTISMLLATVVLAWFLLVYQAPAAEHEWQEDFEQKSAASDRLLQHRYIALSADGGVDQSAAIRVTYQGSPRGSERVVVPLALPFRTVAAQMRFSVRFCDDFQFVRGGKLHGVGPATPVTGGREMTPDGWSARLMFRGDGGLMSYIYHQDKTGAFGDTITAENFRFEPGRYYDIEIHVRLNQPAAEANGDFRVLVDGRELIHHQQLRYRDTERPDSEIQRFLFSTFHGGNSPAWAPKDDAGNYRVECAYFDNLAVSKLGLTE